MKLAISSAWCCRASDRWFGPGSSHVLKSSGREITEYLHHFVDEENKHMVMFGEFCNRYIGKVYPEKKISLGREYAKGKRKWRSSAK